MAKWPTLYRSCKHSFFWLSMVIATLLLAGACSDGVIGVRLIPDGEIPRDSLATLVYRIDLDPSADTLEIGDSVTLEATARVETEGGLKIAIEEADFFTWSSEDTTVATVDAGGVVAGRSAGATQVKASVGDVSVAAEIVVLADAPEAIGVQPDSVSLVVGESAQLTVSSAATIEADAVAWTSSDTTVAAVNATGRVTGRAAGVARIEAKYDGVADTATVYVTAAADPDPEPNPSGLIAAFPGAEGFGAEALNACDRENLEVLTVTNTNDSGSGSLRDAIARSDPEKLSIIVFRTGGTIVLNSKLLLDRGCLYIAGQTAPGGGIQLRADGNESHRLTAIGTLRDRTAHDVVLRYLRVRVGRGQVSSGDNISISSGYRIVLDHVSVAWGNDEGISISPVKLENHGQSADHITIQNSLIAATLSTHSAGSIIGSAKDEPDIRDISVHRNAYIHNTHRNPLIRRVKCIEVVNNVVYNWRGRATNTYGDACIDFIGNYYKKGPWSDNTILQHVIEDAGGETEDPRLYMRGNVVDPLQMDPNADQRNLIRYHRNKTGPLPSSAFVNERLAHPEFPIRDITSAATAFEQVLAAVGASRRLACDGSWVDNRDRLDELLIQQVRNGGGPSTDAENDHENDYGGHPTLARGTPCADSDGDGMPDAFETRYGLNPQDRADARRDRDGDGYRNIEEYVNGTSPR